jgi:hypothetical protein
MLASKSTLQNVKNSEEVTVETADKRSHAKDDVGRHSSAQVDKDSIFHEGQDLEVEMLGDRNVLAKGIGAIALFGEDENTIVSVDQKELTLQEYPIMAKLSNAKKKVSMKEKKTKKNFL